MFRRSQFLIDPKVQGRVVASLALVAIVGAVAICGSVYSYHRQVALVLESGTVAPEVLASEFRNMTSSLMLRLGVILVIMTASFVAMGFVITHRIAGPLYKLRLELQRMLQGEDINPIRFRKDDEFQDLPDLINRLVDKASGKGRK